MPDQDPAPMFDATGGAAAEGQTVGDPAAREHAAEEQPAAGSAVNATETVADRRARAARIRERSMELVEALGADHPLVAEALARADDLDRVTAGGTEALRKPAPGTTDGTDADTEIDLRSSADLPH